MTSHSIRSIGQTIDYCLQPIKISDVLISDGLDLTGLSLDNSTQHDTSVVKSEFLLYQNERLHKPYLSLIISPEIALSKDSLKSVVIDMLKEMKLDNNQMIAITHEEMRGDEGEKVPIKHVHVLINRVDYNGNTFNDSYIGLKGIQAISRIAQKKGLKDVYNTRSYGEKTNQKVNSEFHLTKSACIEEMRSLIKPLIHRSSTHSIDDLFDELTNELFVEVQIEKYKNGRFGVTFQKDGLKIKASEVSRYLSVIPFENTYSANKLLQPILDNNISNSYNNETPKTEKEIKEDYLEHGNYNQLLAELTTLTAFFKQTSQSKKDDQEDDEFESFKKKRRKRNVFDSRR